LAAADTLIRESLEDGTGDVGSSQVAELMEVINQEARKRHDVVRCGLVINLPRRFNRVVRRARSLARQWRRYGLRGARAHLHQELVTFTSYEPDRLEEDQFPRNPAGYVRGKVRALKEGQLGFFEYHVDGLPLLVGRLARTKKTAYAQAEVQISWAPLWPMRCVQRVAYTSPGEKTLEAAGFSLDFVEETRKRTQASVKKI